MSTYLITGVSRGIGFGFLRQISQDPANTVVGLVRDKAGTDKKIATELGELKNVHILQADLSNYDELKSSVAETAKITGGSLDYIIANAAFVSTWSSLESFGSLADQPEKLAEDLIDSFKTNVVGNVHLFNLYIPLVLKGKAKKIITITTGLADGELSAKFKLTHGAPYSLSKAAMNFAVAKYSAEYSDSGVLFLAISPGVVDTGHLDDVPPEQQAKLQSMLGKFVAYAPDFKGPITVEESVKAVLSVTYNASLEKGDGGAFVSHHGNKQWI
ncbi:hypothetical protein AK830_g8975 [Neonectria ditissima]|uniref:NAD(P)-binding protein n=1 Tax=Neonectria ditissima TaxID=78410 RepID=A0A0P7BA53_9HYPO|nr:hypothetical protein AK830_g8975 [Neonectria ditissima]